MKYFISEEQKEDIISRVSDSARADLFYYIMICLACTIATFGLLSNSAAVIIGAMLISPLMGSILGSSMSIANEDNKLLVYSLKTLIFGTLIAIGLAAVLTFLMPVKLITSEILSRTKPTIIDLIIGLASGAAISTALMPPLCVVGIGIASKNSSVAVGAILLFMANIIAINFASILIFKIFGFKKTYRNKYRQGEHKSKSLRNNLAYSVVLLVLISIPLTYFMLSYFDDNRVEEVLRTTIREEFVSMDIDAQLVSLNFNNSKTKCVAQSVVRSNRELQRRELRQIENLLEYKLGKKTVIDMDVILVQRINNEISLSPYQTLMSYMNDITDKQEEYFVDSSNDKIIEKYYTPEQILGDILDEKLSIIEGLDFDDFTIDYKQSEGIYRVNIFIRYNEAIDKKMISLITSLLEDKVKRKVSIDITQKYRNGDKESDKEDSKKKTDSLKENPVALPEEEFIVK